MCSGAWFQEKDSILQNTPSEVRKLMSELRSASETARVQTWH